jgi:predicted metal-dependent hydrolase
MSRTNKRPATPPARLLPDRELPPYAYVPGQAPHPTRDRDGHSFGNEPDTPAPPDPENWRSCRDYLYGIDLFNHGFYWEAHEAWEGLWVACGRQGTRATYLQALINLAATGFKARWGSARGMRANAKTAARLFRSAARQLGPQNRRYMGFDVRTLEAHALALRDRPLTDISETPSALRFDLLLQPE